MATKAQVYNAYYEGACRVLTMLIDTGTLRRGMEAVHEGELLQYLRQNRTDWPELCSAILPPNAGLNRPVSRSEAEAVGSELKPLLGEGGGE